MRLLIFPGSASPCNSLYREVYQLLRSGAETYGYDGVDTSLRWPGHYNADGCADSKLTLEVAVNEAAKALANFEKTREPYHILARSFGNYVAMATILKTRPQLLERLILWAPPPYWILWKMFVRDRRETEGIAREKWLAFDETFFPSVTPLETMVADVCIPCVAATGTKDKYCTHEYLLYLKSCARTETFIVRNVVEDAIHEVHPGLGEGVVADYLEALFGNRFSEATVTK